jgi:hypothetical protein
MKQQWWTDMIKERADKLRTTLFPSNGSVSTLFGEPVDPSNIDEMIVLVSEYEKHMALMDKWKSEDDFMQWMFTGI